MTAGIEALEHAAACAGRAASESTVDVREVAQLPDLTAITALYNEIWRPDGSQPISIELLRALSKAGNYVAAAFDRDRLVGASVGFFTAPAGGALHSHIAGVSATVLGRHVGYALKLHQRAWALRRDVRVIEWTFDPLVARNAYFNIVKLGGLPAEYLPNFYGGMRDGINGDDDTDRLLLRWQLTDPRVLTACSGQRQTSDANALLEQGAQKALRRGENGEPIAEHTDAATVLVAVPPDVEALRAWNPGQAKEWRIAVRETLGALLAGDARVTGFDRDGWYIVQRRTGVDE
ncbi:MAG TPA: GNAT family N-acetyltransferase [Pseudonocardiaceae bacterium]|jgi:predicted GNAT superfamily acetyltransferase|nr:GNAT family N-acetyltransferase [Pseudonocardiaceae bacterium]